MSEEVTLAEMIRRANDVKSEIKIVLELAGQQMTDVPFADYPDKIRAAVRSSGSGGGSNVTFVPELLSGTKIGTIYINGVGVDMYCTDNTDLERQIAQKAPLTHTHRISDVSSADGTALQVILDSKAENVMASSVADGLMSMADKIKLDSVSSNAKSVSFVRHYDVGTKIGTITIDGRSTDLYCESTFELYRITDELKYRMCNYSEIDLLFEE